jgi:hypothetical protein
MIAQAIFAPSAYRAPSPLNWQFNIATRALAALHAPGWVASDDAPATYDELDVTRAEHGRIVVWTGASENTIFDDPETNWAFRAWHDAAHLAHGLLFTIEGETATAYVQASHLIGEYGDGDDVVEMVALLLCEVVGQAERLARYGEFPADQMAHARIYWPKFMPEAARIVGTLSVYPSARKREARAIKLASARLRVAK